MNLLKKTLLHSFIIYISFLAIGFLLRFVMPDTYDIFQPFTFLTTFIPSVVFYALFSPIFLFEIWGFTGSVTRYGTYALIGLFYFFIPFFCVMIFHLRRNDVRKNFFKSLLEYIYTYRKILFSSIIAFPVLMLTAASYIVFKINYPDLTLKEHNHCIETDDIKTDFPFRMSEKSVCIHNISCEAIGLECEHDNSNGWRVAKYITKDNFDFRYIVRDEGLALPKRVLVYRLDGTGYAYITTKDGGELTLVDYDTFEYLDNNVYRDANGYFIRNERVSDRAALEKLQRD